MAVKGSGGDLRSMGTSGFAILYLDKLERLIARYRGEAFEDEMVGFYPLCAFGENRVAASIDTPLHAFLPFDHVDHLHPDWAIALAASANGQAKLEEFNKKYGRKIIWVPWQRPGFELALMLKRAVEANPGCDGLILGGHGLFTWGDTQKECYLNSVRTIDQMGAVRAGPPRPQRRAAVRRRRRSPRRSPTAKPPSIELFPALRGAVSSNRRVIGHYDGSEDALDVRQLALGGGSLPDGHELPGSLPAHAHLADVHPVESRRREPGGRQGAHRRAHHAVPAGLRRLLPGVRRAGFAEAARQQPVGRGHPRARAVRLRQGQARGAHHHRVLRQRDPRDGGRQRARRCGDGAAAAAARCCRRCGGRSRRDQFKTFQNYVALPRLEAFRIEYWALEEAKLQRMPPERELSRRIAVVVGGGSGIGREVALQIARRGGHVVVADANTAGAEEAGAARRRSCRIGEMVASAALDLTKRDTIAAALPQDGPAVRRRRHRRQHRGDLSDAGSVDAGRGRVGEDAADQRDVQLRAGAGSGEGAEGAEPAGVDRADELGERARAEGRQRGRTTSARRRSTTWCASWRSGSDRWCA